MRLGVLSYAALFALGWLVLAPRHAAAQPCPTDKYCFYVPPGLPFDGSHSQLASREFDIVLSSPVRTVTGTYSVSGGAAQPFSVSPGTSERIALGNAGAALDYGTAGNVGVFLVSDAPDLTVDHRETFSDEQYSETIKRDTISLGTRFRLGGYSLNRELRTNAGVDAALIYAPTGATVTLSAPPGAPLPYWLGSATADLAVTLGAGQTIALRTVVGTDMDGALLTASQPVAVSAGGRGWSTNDCGDDGMDGLVPTSALGREFAVRLPTGTDLVMNESRVRVIADVDGTQVSVNGSLVATLMAGSFYNFAPSALSYIETSQPAMVWMNGSLNGCELDTVLIPPIAFAPALTELSLDFNVIASTETPAAEMAILIATSAVSTIELGGVAPTLLANELVPGRADLSYVRFNVAPGDRNVRARSDFQALLASRTAPSGLLAYYNPYRIPGCGDSGIDPGEQCDDANASDGDGCSSTCQIEPGYTCSGAPSVCVTTCGNNTVNVGETCDDGNRSAGDGCNVNCRREVVIATPASGASVMTATPTITGSADPGASLMITLDGASGVVTADGSGNWSYTPTSALTDGPKMVMVGATDTASGVSSANRSFTIDTGTMVAITGPTGLVSQALPTVTGTGEVGAQIAVSIDGMNVGTATVGGDGTWSLPLTTPLSAGEHRVRADGVDQLGNRAQDEQGFRYDSAQNDDQDGDGRPDSEECTASPCEDRDGDGTPDVNDPDDDDDGLPTAQECMSAPCPDSDGDGRPDYLDPDDDGDGRPTIEERGADGKPRDTDNDGTPDHLDPDDDGDGLATRSECMAAPCPDHDGDGMPDFLDWDDDNDRVPTAHEFADSERLRDDDADDDGVVNWLDPDANDNGADDGTDGIGDRDGDGTPDYLDRDTAPPSTLSAVDYSVAGGGGCALYGQATGAWWMVLLALGWRRRLARN